jgi:hypothetical protein
VTNRTQDYDVEIKRPDEPDFVPLGTIDRSTAAVAPADDERPEVELTLDPPAARNVIVSRVESLRFTFHSSATYREIDVLGIPSGELTSTAPTAICRDRSLTAGASRRRVVGPEDIDGGSFDPDSEPIVRNVSPAEGLEPGVHEVTLTVVDAAGLSDECVAVVTIEDQERPLLSCPDAVTVEANDAERYAGSIGEAIVEDACGAVTVTNDAPLSFPPGTTQVTWTATDSTGNASSCAHSVTVTVAPPPDAFVRGDCNGDHSVDLSDPIAALGFAFLGGADLACLEACDFNADGAIDITNAIFLLRALFLGGPTVVPPRNCGGAAQLLGCDASNC